MKSQQDRNNRKMLVGAMTAQLAFGLTPAAFSQVVHTPALPASVAATASAPTYHASNQNLLPNGSNNPVAHIPTSFASTAANLPINSAGTTAPMPVILSGTVVRTVMSPSMPVNTFTVINSSALNAALTVKSGSSYIIDITNPLASNINLTGNLSNGGQIYIVSSNPAITHVTVSASNIYNGQGALLTTLVPSLGFPGLSLSLVPNLTLSLAAFNNIINTGTISSAGGLNLNAGGTITNALPAGIAGAGPILMASNQLTMQAPNIVNAGQILAQQGSINAYTNNLTNSGLMQSVLSNINVQNFSGNTLSVINTLGTMQALNSINFQTLASNSLSTAALNLTGGTITAQTVNFVSSGGSINVNAGTISGNLNLSGDSAVIGVSKGDLSITSLNLTGDPSFYNTGGSVTVSNFNTPGEDLAIVASQDVIVTGNLATSPGAQAGDITLIAGANFVSPGTSNLQVGPDLGTTLTINGGSLSGGSVQVAGSIATSGGNLVAAAYTGSGAGSTFAPGTISIGGAIQTGSTAITNTNGNVTMISGATSGQGISTGAITTSGTSATGNAGVLVLAAATPVINGGTLLITNGVPTPNPPFATTGLISTAATISTGNLTTAGTNGASGAPGAAGGDGGTGGAISLTGAGNSPVTGTISSVGGNGGAGGAGAAGGNGGNGGAISLSSLATLAGS